MALCANELAPAFVVFVKLDIVYEIRGCFKCLFLCNVPGGSGVVRI